MNDLYDVLEICLQEMDNGADVDTVLFHYPEHADELRPILEASVQAKSAASPDPSPEGVRRGRAKVLQQAAQMREKKAQPSRRFWSVPLRRALVSLAVIAALFMGSTGLVHASSTTLPGDQLYPVKRTWEDVLVLFTFNTQAREALEVEHENERLTELNELFAEKRSAKVDFAGTVTGQNGNLWIVSKVQVLVTTQTEMSGQAIAIGSAIRVRGHTQADGTVLAEHLELLPAGIPLPSVDDEHESGTDQEAPEQQSPSHEDKSGNELESQTAQEQETEAPEENASADSSSLDGRVDSISGSVAVVNGQTMDFAGAEIKGTPKAGAEVKVEGYYDANGAFIVTKMEFQSASSEDQSGSSTSSGSSDSSGGSGQSGSNSGGSDDSGSGGTSGGGSDNSGGSGSSGGGGDD